MIDEGRIDQSTGHWLLTQPLALSPPLKLGVLDFRLDLNNFNFVYLKSIFSQQHLY